MCGDKEINFECGIGIAGGTIGEGNQKVIPLKILNLLYFQWFCPTYTSNPASETSFSAIYTNFSPTRTANSTIYTSNSPSYTSLYAADTNF